MTLLPPPPPPPPLPAPQNFISPPFYLADPYGGLLCGSPWASRPTSGSTSSEQDCLHTSHLCQQRQERSQNRVSSQKRWGRGERRWWEREGGGRGRRLGGEEVREGGGWWDVIDNFFSFLSFRRLLGSHTWGWVSHDNCVFIMDNVMSCDLYVICVFIQGYSRRAVHYGTG